MNMKATLWIILCFSVSILHGQGLIDDDNDFVLVDQVTVENTVKASKPTSMWNFEIENKTDQPLYVQLFNDTSKEALLPAGKGTVSAKSSINNGYLRAAGINPRQKITMYVWWKKEDRDVGRQVDLGKRISPQDREHYRANRSYTFAEDPERTSLFFTWDKGEPKLYPSKGKGIFSKSTNSGLPIKNNCSPRDISKEILRPE